TSSHSNQSSELSPSSNPDTTFLEQLSNQLNQLNMTSTSLPAAFLKTVKAPSFSGLHNEDVEEWIMRVERYLQLFDITEAHLKVASALTLLKNHASAWALTFNVTTETTWKQFTDAIKERFGNLNQFRQDHQHLHHLKQNGFVSNYNNNYNKPRHFQTNNNHNNNKNYYNNNNKPQCFQTNKNHHTQNNNNNNQSRPQNNGIYTRNGPEPMHLDALQYKQQQKQQDAHNNACFYCHKP
ncbi:hypothetical protein BGZ49_004788, partial [Haplosporangium sp. Z 27]